MLHLQAKEAIQLIYGHFNLDDTILSAAFYAADSSMDGTINKIEFRQLLLYINYFQRVRLSPLDVKAILTPPRVLH